MLVQGIHLANERTIVDVLRRRVKAQASRRLYTWLDDDGWEVENWTFSDLDMRARSIASQLQGVAVAGEKALLLYPPGLESIAAFFGCLYTGIIAVTSNMPRHRRSDIRLRSIVKDAQPDFLLTTSANMARKADYIDKNPELGQLKWLATDKPASPTVEQPFPTIKENDIAFLQYTSGSTADPKGVIVTHENLLANQVLIAYHYSIKLANVKASNSLADTIFVSWLPLFHDFGLLGPVLSAVYLGCRSINMAPVAFLQKPIRWLTAISRYKGTWTAAPNFAYDLCVQAANSEKRELLDLSSLNTVLNAAEPVRVETLERFTKTFEPCGFRTESFTPCYGLAEATLLVSANVDNQRLHVNRLALTGGEAHRASPNDPDAWELASCGVAGDQTGVYVVDPNTLERCDPGQVGEIWVEGRHVSPGYWNKPEQTKSTFQAFMSDTGDGPYLRTGDLGFILNKQLFITGRLKELIIIRGKNHFPQDIELTVEASHSALQPGSGAAFGVDTGGEELLLVAQEVKRSAQKKLDVEEVSTAVRLAVAQQHGVTIDGLLLVKPLGIPKTTSGKIRRLAAREAYLDGTLRILDQWISDRITNRDATSREDLLARAEPFVFSHDPEINASQLRNWIRWRISLLSELLDKDLDLARPFTDYGLDSLVSIQLINELAEWSSCSIELAKLWEMPSIKDLIDYVVGELSHQITAKDKADSEPAPASRIDGEGAEQLLEKIGELSEVEIDRLLEELDEEDSDRD